MYLEGLQVRLGSFVLVAQTHGCGRKGFKRKEGMRLPSVGESWNGDDGSSGEEQMAEGR